MKRLIILILTLFITSSLSAQSAHKWEEIYEELLVSEEQSTEVIEEYYNLLCDLEANPINLNVATRDDLEQLPFLSAQQVEDILAYIYQYHNMQTLGELMMIESLDAVRRDLLCCFVYLQPVESNNVPTFSQMLKRGKHTIVFTGKVPFYKRKGDENGYLGYPYTHSVRYKLAYSDYFQLGLVGAQDAGEPFFTGVNKLGYDHYSFYAMVRKLGKLKAAVVGRYKVRFGQGLVMNTDFSFGKVASLTTEGRSYNAVRPHSSRSQSTYLQGAAATVALGRFVDFTAFASYRYCDATLNSDGSIRTLLTSGYHRTPMEISKKHNASQSAFGGNLNWRKNGLTFGLTGLYTSFNRPLKPNVSQCFRLNYPQGSGFGNIGLSYGYINHRWNVNGETALSANGGLATVNTVALQATRTLSFTAIQRYYAAKYWGIYANSFAEGGRTQNELGLLIGAKWVALPHLTLMCFTDYAYFAQPRYQASVASSAWDSFLSAIYARGNHSLLLRHQFKLRQKDDAKHIFLLNDITHRGRLSYTYLQPKWSCKTQLDFSNNHFKTNSFGYMVSETATWHPLDWLQTASSVGYFHTESYASRLYTYERGMAYSFYFPAYYGEGLRFAVFAQTKINSHLVGVVKFGMTKYFDRDQISSGLQQINSCVMSALDLQLRWKM